MLCILNSVTLLNFCCVLLKWVNLGGKFSTLIWGTGKFGCSTPK